MKRVPKAVWIILAILVVAGVAASFLPARKVTTTFTSGAADDK